MIVSLDIEHIVLIAHIVDAIERRLHIGKAMPLAPLYYRHPLLQSRARVRVFLYIFLQGLFGKDSHRSIICSKDSGFFRKTKENSKIKNQLLKKLDDKSNPLP